MTNIYILCYTYIYKRRVYDFRFRFVASPVCFLCYCVRWWNRGKMPWKGWGSHGRQRSWAQTRVFALLAWLSSNRECTWWMMMTSRSCGHAYRVDLFYYKGWDVRRAMNFLVKSMSWRNTFYDPTHASWNSDLTYSCVSPLVDIPIISIVGGEFLKLCHLVLKLFSLYTFSRSPL